MRVGLAVKHYNLFKQKKHRQFNYRPRYQNEEHQNKDSDFEDQWRLARLNSQKRGKRLLSLPVLLVMLIALIVLIYVLNGYI